MPIPVPNLDDRSFDDLVADLVARIPAHTPEWTDPQVGDPGRTLIDLFAWLGDIVLYRANLIPERQRLAFLRLLDLPLRPARPAKGLLSLSLSGEGVDPVPVPRRSNATGVQHFETMEECQVLPLSGVCMRKRRPNDEELAAMEGVVTGMRSLYDDLSDSLDLYVPEPVFAEEVPYGLDICSGSVDKSLWIALMAPAKVDPATVRHALGRDQGGVKVLNLGLVPWHGQHVAVEGLDLPRMPIDLRVQVTTGRRLPDNSLDLLPCESVLDTSDGLRQPGVMRVQLPDAGNLGVPVESDPRLAGVGDNPPLMEDPEQAERVVAWVRLSTGADVERLPLRWVGINAVGIEQLRTHPQPSIIGTGNGVSAQRVSLPASDVDPASVLIEVEEEDGFTLWQAAPVLAGSGPGARVFTVDSGAVRFGDDIDGRMPPAGGRIRLLGYRSGGGASGNLPGKTLKNIGVSGVKVEQPVATVGGVDAETLDAAERRIPAFLQHRDRCITAADYQRLALDLPDASVGRAEVLPRFKPHEPTPDVPGVVSVMVLPAVPFVPGPAPRPDRHLVDKVHGWLDQRRPLATELYIIGPDYVPLAATVALQVSDPANRDAILQAIRLEIRRHFWPLVPGGMNGSGWPLGEPVRVQELSVVIARMPGVRVLAEVALFTRKGGVWKPLGNEVSDRLALEAWQLPELERVLVVEGDAAPDASALGPGGGSLSGDGLAVPVVPQHCDCPQGGA